MGLVGWGGDLGVGGVVCEGTKAGDVDQTPIIQPTLPLFLPPRQESNKGGVGDGYIIF